MNHHALNSPKTRLANTRTEAAGPKKDDVHQINHSSNHALHLTGLFKVFPSQSDTWRSKDKNTGIQVFIVKDR